MTQEEIFRLATLPAERFERREWVALAYARDWALFQGETPDQALAAEYAGAYNEEQRQGILAWITAANFANRFNNTFMKPLELPQAYSPPPQPGEPEPE